MGSGRPSRGVPCPSDAWPLWFPGDHRARADDRPPPPRLHAAAPRPPEATCGGRLPRGRGRAHDGTAADRRVRRVRVRPTLERCHEDRRDHRPQLGQGRRRRQGAEHPARRRRPPAGQRHAGGDGRAQHNLGRRRHQHRHDDRPAHQRRRHPGDDDLVPRDSYVDIPGVGKGKLNSAFYFGTLNGGGDKGGAKLLIQTIQNLSGLSIDHYVRVSLLGFYQVVKELGPVDVCLNNAVNDRYSGVDLPKGKSTLDAKQALSFVRQRHGLPNGDLDRNVRQQYFLSQEARKVLSAGTLLNPVKMGNILGAVGSSIQTDTDLLSLASQMRNLRPGNIQSATIPTLGTPTITVNGSALSIVQVDTVGLPAFVQGLVGEPEQYTKATAAQPAATTVTVLNGSGVVGAAAAAGRTSRRAASRSVRRVLGDDEDHADPVPRRPGSAGQGRRRRRTRCGRGPDRDRHGRHAPAGLRRQDRECARGVRGRVDPGGGLLGRDAVEVRLVRAEAVVDRRQELRQGRCLHQLTARAVACRRSAAIGRLEG
ncbi:LCP family protein [Curtobacterium flaccumfaciens]|nr:LCP family protein [Curtobacterium flaccumfaciens]